MPVNPGIFKYYYRERSELRFLPDSRREDGRLALRKTTEGRFFRG